MDAKFRKQLYVEMTNILESIKRQKLGESNGLTTDSIDKSMASLKTLAMKAQRQWEKDKLSMNEQEPKKWLDDPKKDYSGYHIEDPESKYALRNFPPTDDPKELERRKWHANMERARKKAPQNWLEKMAYGKPGIWKDTRTGSSYSADTGREWVDVEYILNRDLTNEEWKLYQSGKGEQIIANAEKSSNWLDYLTAILKAFLFV